MVVRRDQAGPPAAGVVDEPADEQDPARGGLNFSQQYYTPTRTASTRTPSTFRASSRFGDTAGGDATAPRVNQFAGGIFFPLSSGSLNSAAGQWRRGDPRHEQLPHARVDVVRDRRATTPSSATTARYFTQAQTNKVNTPQMTFNYVDAGGDLRACSVRDGHVRQHQPAVPEDPNNTARHPVPAPWIQHRLGDAERQGVVHGVLRAGSVDAERLTAERRASLRQRDAAATA